MSWGLYRPDSRIYVLRTGNRLKYFIVQCRTKDVMGERITVLPAYLGFNLLTGLIFIKSVYTSRALER